MGPPISLVARSTSTWIHWWSPVASANLFTRSWSMSMWKAAMSGTESGTLM